MANHRALMTNLCWVALWGIYHGGHRVCRCPLGSGNQGTERKGVGMVVS